MNVARHIELLGGQVEVKATRDTVSISSNSWNGSAAGYVQVLTRAVTGALLHDHEVQEGINAKGLWSLAPPGLGSGTKLDTSAINDLAYATAFGRVGLGNMLKPPSSILKARSGEDVRQFYKERLVGSNVVVSATGIDHQDLVALVEDSCGRSFPATAEKAPAAPSSTYVGGDAHVLKGSAKTLVAVAFPAPAIESSDVPVAAVINFILGGGHHFSEGGPGKGMYSVLYRNVLCVDTAFDAAFSEYYTHPGAGLLVLLGATSPAQAANLASLLSHEASMTARLRMTDDIIER